MHGELEIINVKEPLKYKIMPGGFLVLGRSHSADVVLTNDPTMSRLHCKIFYQEKNFWIQNLKSTNHTLVNERKVKDKQLLKDGDFLQVGYYKIKFSIISIQDDAILIEPFAAVKRTDKLIGKIAMKLGILNQERLKSAVKKQTEIALDGLYFPLEDILINENYLSKQSLLQIQNYQNNILVQIPSYKIQELIGMGGMGHIYTARCLKTKKIVACKIFSTTAKAHETQIREQFQREAKALLEFHHPHIVSGIESGDVNGIPYIVMEYVDGPTLQQHLKDNGGRLLTDEALRIVIQVVQALEHAHQKDRVHRDIKPENILLTKDFNVKLCDFGLVRDTTTIETDESVFGTVAYMSPEQIKGNVNVDIRSDIYSLGAVFYRLLFGKLPFVGDNKRIRQQHLDEPLKFPEESGYKHKHDLIHVIRKMMAKSPEQRYQTPQELLDVLNKIKYKLSQLDDLQATEELPRDMSLNHENVENFNIPSYSAKKIIETAELRNPVNKKTGTHELPNLEKPVAKLSNFVPTRELSNPAGKKFSTTEERYIPNASGKLASKNNLSDADSTIISKKQKQSRQRKMLLGIVSGLAIMILSTVTIVLYSWMQRESRDWQKFWQAIQNANFVDIQKYGENFLQKYPDSSRISELKEQWQIALWKEAYTKPVVERLIHAQPLCEQIRQINPHSAIAKQAQIWLADLQEEERKRKEREFLQSKLRELQQQIALIDITTENIISPTNLANAQKTWSEYENRWLSNAEFKAEALKLQEQLQERILRKRMEAWKYYDAEQLEEEVRFYKKQNESINKASRKPNSSDVWQYFLLGNRPLFQPGMKNAGTMMAANSVYCHCVFVSDGRVLWTESLSGKGNYQWIWLTPKNQETQNSRFADKVILSQLQGKQIKVIAIGTGKTLLQILLPSDLSTPCLLFQDEILASCQNGYTYRISLKNGAILGAWYTESVICESGILSSKVLFLKSEQNCYQFDLSSRKLNSYLPLSHSSAMSLPKISKKDFATIPNLGSKIKFPGVANSPWQLSGDYHCFTTVEKEEVWCHILKETSQQQKQLLWQRRLNIPITQILSLKKEKILWMALQDGALIQAIPNTKSFVPAFKPLKGNLYANMPSQLLYLPQDINNTTAKIVIVRNVGISQMMTLGGDFVKDWSLKESLENIGMGLTQLQGKFLLVPQQNLIKCFSLVSGRKIVDIQNSQKFTMPLFAQNLNIWTGDQSGNFQSWNANIQTNSLSWQKSWAYKANGSITSMPGVTNKAIYFGDDIGNFYSLQIKTGQQNWIYTCQSGIKSCIVTDTIIYIGDQKGNCYALDANTGKLKWQQALETTLCSEMVLGKNKIYLATCNAEIYSLDLQTGNIAWSLSVPGKSVSSFVVLENRIYIGTDAGWLTVIQDR